MLDTRQYTQKELCDLFNTDRNDVIKKKLTSQGYIYTTEGRGKNLIVTITGYEPPLHAEFKEYCINELGFAPQTDFDKLYIFFSKFIFDDEFRRLPFIEITRRLESDVKISRQTISKWIKHLLKEDILGEGNYYYYAHGYDEEGNKKTVPINEQTYKNGWSEYWTGKETSYEEAVQALVSYICGFPQKVPEKVFNAFNYKKVERLINIIEKEKKANE